MPLEATPLGLVAQVPKPSHLFPSTAPFPSLSSPSPLADGRLVCRAKAQDPRQRHKPRSERHTDDQRHGPKRDQASS